MHQYVNQHWFRQWLVAWPAPSHEAMLVFFLFQIYLYRVNHSVTLFFHGALLIYIVNWTLRKSGTNFNEILIGIHKSLFKKMHLIVSSGKLQPFCLRLNVLKQNYLTMPIHVCITEFIWPVRPSSRTKEVCLGAMDEVVHLTFYVDYVTCRLKIMYAYFAYEYANKA